MIDIVPKLSNIQEIREIMHSHVDKLCDSYVEYNANNKNMAMFCIVILGCDGSYNVSRHITEHASFGRKLLPPIVSEILRLENVEEISEDVFFGRL